MTLPVGTLVGTGKIFSAHLEAVFGAEVLQSPFVVVDKTLPTLELQGSGDSSFVAAENFSFVTHEAERTVPSNGVLLPAARGFIARVKMPSAFAEIDPIKKVAWTVKAAPTLKVGGVDTAIPYSGTIRCWSALFPTCDQTWTTELVSEGSKTIELTKVAQDGDSVLFEFKPNDGRLDGTPGVTRTHEDYGTGGSRTPMPPMAFIFTATVTLVSGEQYELPETMVRQQSPFVDPGEDVNRPAFPGGSIC